MMDPAVISIGNIDVTVTVANHVNNSRNLSNAIARAEDLPVENIFLHLGMGWSDEDGKQGGNIEGTYDSSTANSIFIAL